MKQLAVSVLDRMREVFGLDLRSLAFFRICIALLIIADLINRSRSLVAHYTDFGVMPRHALLEYFSDQWYVSFHLANGTAAFQMFLFGLAFLFALMLLFGYKTRLATILSWMFLVSLQHRNPLVLQGGDSIFKLILFWGMFLPLGAVYSVDSALAGVPRGSKKPYFSMSSIALYVQIILIYWMAILHKSGPEWWMESSAVYYTLQIDQFTTHLGKWVGSFPFVTTALTRLVLFWQMLGPLFLMNPFWFGPLRMAVIMSFVFMQAGFGSSLHLGLFPWIASIAMFGFIPAWFWNELGGYRSEKRTGMKIYYDLDCGFCRRSVRLLTAFLLLKDVEVLPAQSDKQICAQMQEHNSWVVVSQKRTRHYKIDGLIKVLDASPIGFILVPLVQLRPVFWLGTKIYEFVSRRRSLQCRREIQTCQPISLKQSWLTGILVLFLICYVSAWNISNVKQQEGWFPENLIWLGRLISVDQAWNMFAPSPLKEDGWHVIPGTLLNGREVDLFTGTSPVHYEKPEHVSTTYPTQRWRKYLMNITDKSNAKYRLYYGQYLCRQWNTTHVGDDRLDTFEVQFYLEKTLPDYQTAPVEKLMLWKHYCFEVPPET